MPAESQHWTSIVTAVVWGAFFVTLIFKPSLASDHPALAAVAIVGVVFWGLRARRTRRKEKQRLAELERNQ